MTRLIVPLLVALIAYIPFAAAEASEPALTVYAAQISGEPSWENVFFKPVAADYIDSYLVAAALSTSYAHYYGGGLQLEAEGAVAYHFGEQHLWEFDAVPIMARWQRFPWSHTIKSSAAFGVGVSYTTEVPPIEVALEGESQQWLVHWVVELTAGPAEGPWEASVRLHHRSVAYGLMGKDGGMNALGFGLRWQF